MEKPSHAKCASNIQGTFTTSLSRGDRREDIFHDEVDRQDFLKTLAEACLQADFQVHAIGALPIA
ncbi:MAG: hypothetical protein O2960_29565 [Verrucomicrobia bacterium]|nr:hypothetical protein [Verrucomicrobiota bacterium]